MGTESRPSATGRSDYPYFRATWNRVVVTLLAAAFVPLLLVGGGLSYFTLKALKEKGLETLKLEALQRKVGVDRYLEQGILSLQRLADELKVDSPASHEDLKAALHSLSRDNEYFTDLALIDSNGRCLAFTDPAVSEESDYSQTSWFREARAKGICVSDVVGGGGNEPYFVFAVRMRALEEAWVLRAKMNASRITRIVANNPERARGDAFLINSEGILQTQPRSAEQLPSSSPVKDLEKFDGIRVEEAQGALLLQIWQDRAPWINVARIDSSDIYGDLRRVYVLAFLVFLVFAIPTVGVVLLTSDDLVSRLEAKQSSLNVLDHKLRRTSYVSSSMELSVSCFQEIKDTLANIDIATTVLIADPAASTSGDLRESIGDIRSEVQRSRIVVERFLRYIRPELSLIREVDVHKLLNDLLDILERELRFRNISFRRAFQPDLPTVRSDRSELRQVFQNLVLNAMDALEDGGEITLTTDVCEDGIAVSVSDNGPGIPETDLKRVFEPLWSTKPYGTGLGLSLCRDILERLNGRIFIESVPAKGTSVTVTIPLCFDTQKFDSTAAESEDAEEGTHQNSHR